MTFVVFGLPRSRTAWASIYLRYPAANVGHDTAVTCSCADDFLAPLEDGSLDGTVETAAMLGWEMIRERLPSARFAVIRRPIGEVEWSLGQFGIVPVPGELAHRASLLKRISKSPRVLTVDYHDLVFAKTRRALFEHCRNGDWDEGWDKASAWRNVQIDVPARMKYLAENRERIEALKASLIK